jgi:hypothetical protein
MVWKPYAGKEQKVINWETECGFKIIGLKFNGNDYVIDTGNMTQTNSTTGMIRKIRCYVKPERHVEVFQSDL